MTPWSEPGEHDRRPELAEPTREREGRAGAEAARCERQRHAKEHPPRAGAERARGGGQRRVDRLEGRDRRPDVERARDEGDGEHDRELV